MLLLLSGPRAGRVVVVADIAGAVGVVVVGVVGVVLGVVVVWLL